jgi:prepilin-type N-terminal cleavage/methylation domain-containing protein
VNLPAYPFSMKQSRVRSRSSKLSSFTLIELLVVIGIIAILAAVLLPAANLAIKAAKRARAATMASQIQTAAMAYYTEYGVYPVGTATADGTSPASIADLAANATAWQNLICSLCGNNHPSTGLAYTAVAATPTNSRGIAFLTMRTSDVDSSDAPLNPLPTGTEIYFNIAMDADYDGVLGVSPSTAVLPKFSTGTATSLTLTGGSSTAGVAVWANCTGTTSYTNANFWVHTY